MERKLRQTVISISLLFTSVKICSSQTTDYKCSAVGKFADPNDCHAFYICDDSLNVSRGTCTQYGRFDPLETCVWETCTNPTPPPVNTPTPTPTGGFKCSAEGYFADPTDCHMYYSCDKNLSPTRSSCTLYGYFDGASQQCLLGSCSDVTVTPSNPGTSAPTTPFVCTTAGYFADPNNCKGFYLCSQALVASHGVCMGGGGHYNPKTKGCEIGPC